MEEYGYDQQIEDSFAYEERLAYCKRILGNHLSVTLEIAKLDPENPGLRERLSIAKLQRILELACRLFGEKGAKNWWLDWTRNGHPDLTFAKGDYQLLRDVLRKDRFSLRRLSYRWGKKHYPFVPLHHRFIVGGPGTGKTVTLSSQSVGGKGSP